MKELQLETPVAFIVFNRLEPVKEVFEVIRKVKPTRLYIISDAARDGKKGEKEKVLAVRDYIESHVDWDCDVHKNYAKNNMGCRDRIVSGINWCFETEEKLIILEDDCLPDMTFFGFAQQLLSAYEDDCRIMHIGGYNMMGEYDSDEPYIFSQRPCAWGWATWRRAWEKYDVNMKSWPEVRDKQLLKWRFANKFAYEDRVKEWDDIYYGNIDAWGYAWDYALMINNALAIFPTRSLVQNIGFGLDATHTVSKENKIYGEKHDISLPLNIRKECIIDYKYDSYLMRYSGGQKVKKLITKMLPKSILNIYYKIKRR